MNNKWNSITDIVQFILRRANKVPSDLPLRHRASLMGIKAFGLQTMLEIPSLINIAALAGSIPDRFITHRVSPGAIQMIHDTDLHTLPGDAPRLLRSPWIIEAKRPEQERLFGDTVNLAGYPLEDSIFLIGLNWPDGGYVARWKPHWETKDLQGGMPTPDHSPLIDDVDCHYEWAVAAAQFAILFGLHLEADNSPIAVSDVPASRAYSLRGENGVQHQPILRRVYLDRIEKKETSQVKIMPDMKMQKAEKMNQITTQVRVRGHIKRQVYGPRLSQRKWIYVESYESRRWVTPGQQTVLVGVRGEGH